MCPWVIKHRIFQHFCGFWQLSVKPGPETNPFAYWLSPTHWNVIHPRLWLVCNRDKNFQWSTTVKNPREVKLPEVRVEGHERNVAVMRDGQSLKVRIIGSCHTNSSKHNICKISNALHAPIFPRPIARESFPIWTRNSEIRVAAKSIFFQNCSWKEVRSLKIRK